MYNGIFLLANNRFFHVSIDNNRKTRLTLLIYIRIPESGFRTEYKYLLLLIISYYLNNKSSPPITCIFWILG